MVTLNPQRLVILETQISSKHSEQLQNHKNRSRRTVFPLFISRTSVSSRRGPRGVSWTDPVPCPARLAHKALLFLCTLRVLSPVPRFLRLLILKFDRIDIVCLPLPLLLSGACSALGERGSRSPRLAPPPLTAAPEDSRRRGEGRRFLIASKHHEQCSKIRPQHRFLHILWFKNCLEWAKTGGQVCAPDT